MRAYLVKNGVVVNMLMVDSLDVIPGLVADVQGFGIGDLWDGSKFSRQPPALSPVPQSVSKFQAKAALLNAGHLSAVESIMANPAAPEIIRLAWTEVHDFLRLSPTVAWVASALALTDAQVDAMFRYAATVTA